MRNYATQNQAYYPPQNDEIYDEFDAHKNVNTSYDQNYQNVGEVYGDVVPEHFDPEPTTEHQQTYGECKSDLGANMYISAGDVEPKKSENVGEEIKTSKASRYCRICEIFWMVMIVVLIIAGFVVLGYYTYRQHTLLTDYDKRLGTLLDKIDVLLNESRVIQQKNSRENKDISKQINESAKQSLLYLSDKKDCVDLYKNGKIWDSVLIIKPISLTRPMEVYCDQTTDGSGWTVIQRRTRNSTSFANKGWKEYKWGFGDLSNEFWLGNIYLNLFTRTECELRVDIVDFNGTKFYGKYSEFSVGNEESGYKLRIRGYSGNTKESLIDHDDGKFSTIDKDSGNFKGNCTQKILSGWWHNKCVGSNLNELHTIPFTIGNNTYFKDSISKVEMKIRQKTIFPVREDL